MKGYSNFEELSGQTHRANNELEDFFTLETKVDIFKAN